MAIKRLILVLLVCIVAFAPMVVHAENLPLTTNNKIQTDYVEFDSFMKRYNEHTMELSYYLSTSYHSNDHYFKENFEVFRNAINSVFDTNKSELTSKYMDSLENLLSKPIALLGTANDLRAYLFDKIKGFFSTEEGTETHSRTGNTLYPPSGYNYMIEDLSLRFNRIDVTINNSSRYINFSFCTTAHCNNTYNYYYSSLTSNQIQAINELYPKFESFSYNFYDFYKVWRVIVGKEITLVNITTNQTKPTVINVTNPNVERIFNDLNENYDTSRYPSNYEPTVKPILVCPNEVVPLTYEYGKFKTSTGQLITINENETSNYLNTICNLDFKFPEIYYHEDTKKIIVDGEDISKLPSNPVDDYDYSFIDYIRNSYQYATNIIKTGVNGLTSIVNSTTGLLTLFANVFSFLPSELTSLMIGGLAISIGLWVFKR